MNNFRDSDFRTTYVEVARNNLPELCGGGLFCHELSQGRYIRDRGNLITFH